MLIEFPNEEPKVSGGGGGGDFEPIKKGNYEAVIMDGAFKKDDKHRDFVELEYKITEEGDYTNRRVWQRYYLDADSSWKLQKVIAALGVVLKGNQEFDPTSLFGKKIGIYVVPTEPTPAGKVYCNVVSVYSIGDTLDASSDSVTGEIDFGDEFDN